MEQNLQSLSQLNAFFFLTKGCKFIDVEDPYEDFFWVIGIDK